jgi:hypothetical protein
MKHLIKVVVGRDIYGMVAVTVIHDEFVLEPNNIDLADGANKRKTLQATQWNRKT